MTSQHSILCHISTSGLSVCCHAEKCWSQCRSKSHSFSLYSSAQLLRTMEKTHFYCYVFTSPARGIFQKSVADPGEAFGRGSQLGGRLKRFHLFPYPRSSATIVGYHTKVVTFCWPRKWLFLLVEICDLSGNYHIL